MTFVDLKVHRSLYSPSSLGLDAYVHRRGKVQEFFSNDDGDKFRGKMNQYAENNTTSMVFTEDLKNMVHLANDSDTDIELLEKMVKR